MEVEKISSVDILRVRVDKVTMSKAVAVVEEWIKKPFDKLRAGHYIVTPNPEFLMLAQKDEAFRTILNKSDLAIPDGSRLGWASSVLQEKNFLKKILIWLTFLFPPKHLMQFDIVSGVDLMERLCQASTDWGSTIGLLGGRDRVAEKTAECLKKKYPGLKVVFTDSGGEVGFDSRLPRLLRLPKIDILFVAFGQGKQEKWIAQNLKKLPVKVMMGVGGSFDEISGIVPKSPKIISDLKLKWLFRLITQPWRIKRQFQLVKFLWLVLIHSASTQDQS